MKRTSVLVVAALTMLGLVGAGGAAQSKVPGPNGRIAFARFDPSLGDTVTFTMNPDGSHLRRLFPGASGNPRWSPDGSNVTVGARCVNGAENCAATIVDPDTGTFRQLKFPDPTLETFCSVWSADARRLACESHGISDPSRNGIYTIRTSDVRGLKRITSNPGGGDSPIDYSPDGKRLVFSRVDPNRPARANSALFVVNLDGSGVRRITPWGFSDDDGSWSPDGTRILFGTRGSLYTVHPDGSGLVRIDLATSGYLNAFDAGWSPDGAKIIFSLFTAASGQVDLYIANTDGGDLHQVTNDSPPEEKADWGPHPIVP